MNDIIAQKAIKAAQESFDKISDHERVCAIRYSSIDNQLKTIHETLASMTPIFDVLHDASGGLKTIARVAVVAKNISIGGGVIAFFAWAYNKMIAVGHL